MHGMASMLVNAHCYCTRQVLWEQLLAYSHPRNVLVLQIFSKHLFRDLLNSFCLPFC